MSSMSVKVTKGTKELDKILEKVSGRLIRELKTARDHVGAHLEREVKRTLRDQNFTPISPAWKQWKSKHGFDTRILFMTHIMYNMVKSRRYQTSSNVMSGGVTVLDRTYPSIQSLLKRKKSRRIMQSGNQAMRSTKEPKGSTQSKTARSVAMIHESDTKNKRAFFKPTYEREAQTVIRFFERATREALGSLV